MRGPSLKQSRWSNTKQGVKLFKTNKTIDRLKKYICQQIMPSSGNKAEIIWPIVTPEDDIIS